MRLPLVFDSVEEELDVLGCVFSSWPSSYATRLVLAARQRPGGVPEADARDGFGAWKPSSHNSADCNLPSSTLGLLNFLSGHRHALHRLTGRGAFSTIQMLVLSAYISSSDNPDSSILTAHGMRQATVAQLADLARIETHVEKAHPTLGNAVKVGEKDDEAFEILGLLAGVLNKTGEMLERLGKRSMGAWLLEKLVEAEGGGAKLVHDVSPDRLACQHFSRASTDL